MKKLFLVVIIFVMFIHICPALSTDGTDGTDDSWVITTAEGVAETQVINDRTPLEFRIIFNDPSPELAVAITAAVTKAIYENVNVKPCKFVVIYDH